MSSKPWIMVLVSSVFAREQVTLFTSNFVDYSLESTGQFVLDFRTHLVDIRISMLWRLMITPNFIF